MSVYVYPTDKRWFDFLRARSPLDEVNFWQPGGSREFQQLDPGELFFFRLHSPINKIAGGGIFRYASLFPMSGVWDAFGEKNGVRSYSDLFSAINHYRLKNGGKPATADTPIGCIILDSPFFLPESDWISTPPDYHLNLVQGKRFPIDSETGRSLFKWGQEQLAMMRPRVSGNALAVPVSSDSVSSQRQPGSGGFQITVADAYSKRCAITGERTLPVLEAAHIMPIADGGENRVENGILFRSDVRKLFEMGYVTVTPAGEFRVSPSLEKQWMNGRAYYALDGTQIRLPVRADERPSRNLLKWHNDRLFRP